MDKTAWLSSLAGVPIRLFQLQAPDISHQFRTFLTEVPMVNDRPLPGPLIDDTVASLRFLKSATAVDEPSYFVAAYIHKTPFVSASISSRERYFERYGERVYPQRVCPVFSDRAGASASTLLSTATNLPEAYFDRAVGTAENYDLLFGLTEASHCGFIARELVRPTVLPPGLGRRELRKILEALGDYEAIAVFRGADHVPGQADEADVLFAGRLLAMFLQEHENPYTTIPALLHEYRHRGVLEAHRSLTRISESVDIARRTVRQAGLPAVRGDDTVPLAELDARLAKAREAGALAVDDALARRLIADLGPALKLLEGDSTVVMVPERGRSSPATGGGGLITLTGASSFY